MKKKTIAILIVVVIVASMISGCTCSNKKQQTGEIKQTEGVYSVTEDDVSYDKKTHVNYINNIVIVDFKNPVSDSRKKEIAKKIGGAVVGEEKIVDEIYVKVKACSLNQLEKLCKKIEKEKDVEMSSFDLADAIKTNETVNDLAYSPNDPWKSKKSSKKTKENWNSLDLSGNNWWAKIIHAPQMWKTVKNKDSFNYNKKLNEIKVGVVDDGFDTTHEDINLKLLNPNEANVEKHGTHVAGIIGATMDNKKGICGVAPNAKLLCYDWDQQKSFGRELAGSISSGSRWSTESIILSGLSSCVKNGAKVINFSLGTSEEIPYDFMQFSLYKKNHYGKRTSRYMSKLLSKGYDFVVVQSAGNGAANGKGVDAVYNGFFASITPNNCYQTKSIKYRDIINRIFRVAATYKPEEDGKNYLTYYSNGGSNVDVAAPGHMVFSTIDNNGYKELSGTSMAAPIVAGVLAVKWGCDSRLRGDELKECLKYLPFKAYDNKYSKHTKGDYPFIDAWTIIDETLGLDGSVILKQKTTVDYKNYSNSRFGYSLKYPKNFTLENEAANGDGISTKYKKDKLLMYGSFSMVEDKTGKGLKKQYESYGYKMSNVVVGKRSFYFEKKEKGRYSLNYVCLNNKYGTQAGFTIICDKNKLSYYRHIGNEMIKSLKFYKGYMISNESGDSKSLYRAFLKNNRFERYAYIDINKDGQDELIAGSQPMICGIFGIKDGAVITLTGTNDINEAPLYLGEWLMDDAVLYSSKEKQLLTYTMGTSGLYDVWKFKKGKLSHMQTGGKNDEFYINDKKVSSKKCWKYIEKLKRIKIKDVK